MWLLPLASSQHNSNLIFSVNQAGFVVYLVAIQQSLVIDYPNSPYCYAMLPLIQSFHAHARDLSYSQSAPPGITHNVMQGIVAECKLCQLGWRGLCRSVFTCDEARHFIEEWYSSYVTWRGIKECCTSRIIDRTFITDISQYIPYVKMLW